METENRKAAEEINERKTWQFQKVNNMHQQNNKLTKKKIKTDEE